jgi:cytochrome c oxidase subunit 1
VTSWLEGPLVTDGDPWDLAATDQFPREFAWFERERLPALTDGGDEPTGD